MSKLNDVMWCKRSLFDTDSEAVEFAPHPRYVVYNNVDFAIISRAHYIKDVVTEKGYSLGVGENDLLTHDCTIMTCADSRRILETHVKV